MYDADNDGGLMWHQQTGEAMWKDSGGSDFEQPPVGSHIARCVRVIDIGTQKGEYEGKITIKRQVIMMWELPNELMTTGEFAGKPFTASRFYTASLNEKAALRADLMAWRGRDFTEQELAGFDPRNILGKGCMLSLVQNTKGKIKVSGVMALPKNTIVPPQVNESIYFSLDPDEFDQKVFDALSDGYKKMIMVSPEWAELQNPSVPHDDKADSWEPDDPDAPPF